MSVCRIKEKRVKCRNISVIFQSVFFFVAQVAPSLGLPEGLVHGTLIDLVVDVSK